MNPKNPIRPHGPLSILFAVLALLGILIAPVCAPLCAAKHCSAGVRLEHCHEMANGEDRNGAKIVASAKDCGQTEFSAVLGKAEEQSSRSREVRSNPEPAPIRGSLVNAVGTLQASSGRWSIYRVPLESPDSLSLITVLRI
jgi:hypothetical protein